MIKEKDKLEALSARLISVEESSRIDKNQERDPPKLVEQRL